jgi:hypothetical protein
MKSVIAAFLIALAPAALAQATSPAAGHYCLRAELGVGETDEEALIASAQKLDEGLPNRRSKLGLLGVDLDITETAGRTYVAFSNYMPDNGQIVRSAEPGLARRAADGALTFSFTDNWRAAGTGTVRKEGAGVVLTIKRTKPADTFAGEYSDRQFGEFKLNPGTCPPNR